MDEIDSDLRHRRAGEVVDDDGVSAFERPDVDGLDVAHRHRAAACAHLCVAIDADDDGVGGSRALELARIVAVLTVDEVAAFAQGREVGVVAATEPRAIRAAAPLNTV